MATHMLQIKVEGAKLQTNLFHEIFRKSQMQTYTHFYIFR